MNDIFLTIIDTLTIIFIVSFALLAYSTIRLAEIGTKKSSERISSESNSNFEPFVNLEDVMSDYKKQIFNEFKQEHESEESFTSFKKKSETTLFERKKHTVPDYFKVLGFESIPDNVSEVKKRYKKLAKNFHPDSGKGDEELFIAVTEAYNKAKQYFSRQA